MVNWWQPAGGARAVNEQPRATAIGFQRAFGNEETRAGTKGCFKYAFGPGLYYQPGLKDGASRARARKTLWSRLVTRTGTKGPYPNVSLGATDH